MSLHFLSRLSIGREMNKRNTAMRANGEIRSRFSYIEMLDKGKVLHKELVELAK